VTGALIKNKYQKKGTKMTYKINEIVDLKCLLVELIDDQELFYQGLNDLDFLKAEDAVEDWATKTAIIFANMRKQYYKEEYGRAIDDTELEEAITDLRREATDRQYEIEFCEDRPARNPFEL
jgi:hypothetical protein